MPTNAYTSRPAASKSTLGAKQAPSWPGKGSVTATGHQLTPHHPTPPARNPGPAHLPEWPRPPARGWSDRGRPPARSPPADRAYSSPTPAPPTASPSRRCLLPPPRSTRDLRAARRSGQRPPAAATRPPRTAAARPRIPPAPATCRAVQPRQLSRPAPPTVTFPHLSPPQPRHPQLHTSRLSGPPNPAGPTADQNTTWDTHYQQQRPLDRGVLKNNDRHRIAVLDRLVVPVAVVHF